ncbi:MAG TPA: WecB/TagA/CpsF family glycosyltransferase [Patescibacteria group bacterium]|nr:WecB/TagA/CpsF family glycosyltransferase [Patescibacteria group bacterium]
MHNQVCVLSVRVDAISMADALSTIEEYIDHQPPPRLIATANAEMVMMAAEDAELAAALNAAALIVPDGAGVVWAARHTGHPVPERVAGYDLVQNLLARAPRKNYRIYMLGGAPGIVEMAKATAESRFPDINIVGTHNGFFSAVDESAIIENIRQAKPDILLVALGVPKQEKWLARHLNALGVPVSIGVGGTFDVMAGTVQRAPLWMQRTCLEWLFRLLCQPSRIIRMMALPRFVIKVLRG